MPFIRISLSDNALSPEAVARLQTRTTALIADVLGKRREVTVVAVDSLPARNWSIGAQPLAAARLAQMEAFITAGTNTGAEKAAFIAAANDMLADVLGQAASPVYVALIEVAASDWGFDGLTQAARRQANLAD